MDNQLLALLVVLVFVGLAHSCTINGPTTGTVGQQLSFTVTLGNEILSTISCENGVKQTSNTFTCLYTSAGSKTITASASNPDGISSCSFSSVISSASNSPPSVSITSPGAGNPTVSSPVSISGSASDSDGTVQSVEVQIASVNGCGDGQWRPATGTTSWSYSWTAPSGKTGCQIKARSRDNGGTDSSEAIVTVSTSSTVNNANTTTETQPVACTASCFNKIRVSCPGSQQQAVECCDASDCTNTCTGTQYRAPTCSASNQCVYATGVQVINQCGFGAACQVNVSRQTAFNASTAVTVNYQNFAVPVGTINVNCGNGVTNPVTCSGATGTCATNCFYNQTGAVTPRVTIAGITCATNSVTVAPSATTSNPSTLAVTNAANSTTLKPPVCNLTSVLTVNTGQHLVVTAKYSNVRTPPGLINIVCGNGRTTLASGCSANVTGEGECSGVCIYDLAGRFTPTAAISGATCGVKTVNVTSASAKPLSLEDLNTIISLGNDMQLQIDTFVTTPATISENTPAKMTIIANSSEVLANASCRQTNGNNPCSCTILKPSLPNPVVECSVQPPVKGNYEITFTAQNGRIKTAIVPLVPGETASIEVNRNDDQLLTYIVVGTAGLLLLYLLYLIYQKIMESRA